MSALSACRRFLWLCGVAASRRDARSVSFTADLVAPFALRQTTVFSLPCLGIYRWLRAKPLIRRRVLRIPHSRHPSAPPSAVHSLLLKAMRRNNANKFTLSTLNFAQRLASALSGSDGEGCEQANATEEGVGVVCLFAAFARSRLRRNRLMKKRLATQINFSSSEIVLPYLKSNNN